MGAPSEMSKRLVATIFRPYWRPRRPAPFARLEGGRLKPPQRERDPEPGFAVVCRVHWRCFLHLVTAVQCHCPRRGFLIGNNRGGFNGWIPRRQIYGRCVAVED